MKMKKILLMFVALLSFAGSINPALGQVTEGFEYATDGTTPISVNDDNMGLSNGWVVVGSGNYVGISTGTSKDLQLKSGSYVYEGTYSIGTQYSNKNTWLVCPVEVSGTMEFYARQYSSSKSMKVGLAVKSGDSFAISNSNFYTCSGLSSSYQKYTVELGTEPVYIAFQPSYAYFDNVTYTPYVQPSGPALIVKDYNTGQKLTSPANYSFGLATPGTIHYFLLNNPGTEDLGVTVSETGNFGATLSTTTVPAGGASNVALTVTMPDATGSSEITITPASGSGIDPFVINVSGTIRDPNKVYETLLTGSKPEDWTTSGTWTWSTTNGASNSAYYESYNYRIITPQLTVADGESFFFDARGTYSGYQGVKFEYSADGTNWTASSITTTLTSDWQTFEINDIPAGQYYIALHGWQCNIRNFYGGELPQVAKMVVTQPASLDFGVVADDVTKTFTIANTGKAELTGIQVVSSNATTFAISGAPTALAAGESAEVTITMSAAVTGVFNSTITVSATGMENVTFDVTGCVMPDGVMVVDFEDNLLPAGWGNNASNKWSFDNGKAYTTSAAELTTPKLTIKEGDFFVIKATSYDNYDNNYIEVTGSVDGSDWTAFDTKKFVSRSQIPYGSYASLVVSGIPTTVKYIKIKGYYVRIEEIVGLTYDEAAPVLTVEPTTAAAFGKVKAQPEAKTYTITNSGTGTLEGTITSDNAAFTVSKSAFSLAKGESLDFEIALVFDENYGEKAATITIHPTNDGLSDVTIAATATTKDPNVWEEDFEEGALSSVWNNEGSWTVSKPSATGNNGTYMATISSYNNPKSLTTPRLEAKANDELTFYIGMQYDDEPLTIEYSNDDKATWNVIETGVENYTASATLTFKAPADGYYYIRFTGTFAMLDNFVGFKLAMKEHEAEIAASSVPATGNQYVAYTATVTVKELVGKNEEATAKLYVAGEVVATAIETIEANSSKVFTLTFTPEVALTDAEAKIVVTYAGGELATAPVALTITAAPVLSETETLAMAEGTYPVVKLQYTLKAGWNTIILPFAVSDLSVFGEGVKAYQFTRYDENGLGFSEVTSLNPAAEPYLLYSTVAKNEFTFTNVSVNSVGANPSYYYRTQNGVTFQGVTEPITAGSMLAGQYGVTTDGKIMQAGAKSSIKALHAYFETVEGRVKENNTDAKEETVDAPVKYFTFDAVTGIREVEADGANEAVFNLAGQRIQKAQRGINIVNGKKIVVK